MLNMVSLRDLNNVKTDNHLNIPIFSPTHQTTNYNTCYNHTETMLGEEISIVGE